MQKKALSFLENLLTTPSPTGFETRGQKKWMDYVRPFSDEVQTDTYGSAAAFLKAKGAEKTVMIEAHCDEIGMMVQYIDEKGFVSITRLGGSDPAIARARRVHIHTANGTVTGIIGNTAIHLQDKDLNKIPAWKDLYVDIGASTKEEAEQMVRVGNPITYADDFEMLNDDIICGRALDNRIGSFIIAEVLSELSKNKGDLKVNVVALNAVQEEIGGFGARMMSYRIMPEVALVTDVTHATDTPGINPKEHGMVKLGGGPAITHGAASHPKVVEWIMKSAKKVSVEIQHEAASVRTGTDTDSIYFQKTGIASGLISLPLRYMHSPCETASLQDVESLIKLMTACILNLNGDESFDQKFE